jgi:hypothetical protein
VVWKSIESLGRIAILARAVPECRTVVILRHPCGYIASVLNGEGNQRFSAATASGDDFPIFEMLLQRSPHKKRNPALDDLKALSMVERLAWRWLLYNEIALSDLAAFRRCYALRYEDLCEDPLGRARELLRFAGLDWHPQVEQFIQRSTARTSERYYSIYKLPLDAAMKWQRQLSPAGVDAVMSVLKTSDLLADVYSTDQQPGSHRALMPPRGAYRPVTNPLSPVKETESAAQH